MGGARRVALLGAGLTLTAAALDVEPLYVPGVMLLLLAGGASAWVRLAARSLRVTRTLTAGTVVEQQEVEAEIRVHATGLPLAAASVEDPLLGGPAAVHGRRTAVPVRVRFTGRGRRRLAGPRVHVRDPLGLAVRTVCGADHELLVLPAILPLQRRGSVGTGGACGHGPARSPSAADVQLDGLRPLQAGTSAGRIAWATWARTGELLERQLRADGEDRPLVVLDTRTLVPADEERLDAAVRAAASLCVHFAAQGGCSLLLPGDRHPAAIEPSLVSWPRLHVRLALVPAGGAPAATALTGRHGAVVYVSARPLPRVPPALTHVTGRGRVLVVPSALAGRTASFAVGGCLGYDLDGATVRRRSA